MKYAWGLVVKKASPFRSLAARVMSAHSAINCGIVRLEDVADRRVVEADGVQRFVERGVDRLAEWGSRCLRSARRGGSGCRIVPCGLFGEEFFDVAMPGGRRRCRASSSVSMHRVILRFSSTSRWSAEKPRRWTARSRRSKSGDTSLRQKIFAEEQIETAGRRVEGAVGMEVETQRPGSRRAELEEDGVPREAPEPRRLRVERQAVAEESETHVAVFAANGIVKMVVSVAHGREATDGGAEERKLLAAAAVLLGIDAAELAEAVVGRRVEVGAGLRLGEGQTEESPEVEFVARGKSLGAGDADAGFLTMAVLVGVPVAALVDVRSGERCGGVERAEGVFDERELRTCRRSEIVDSGVKVAATIRSRGGESGAGDM